MSYSKTLMVAGATATAASINAELIKIETAFGLLSGNLLRAPQVYAASGANTLATGTKRIAVRLVGGGGAGGGTVVDGALTGVTTDAAAGNGGQGGASCIIALDVTSLSVAFVAGAGGSGALEADGGGGGETSITIDGVTYAAPGGFGGARGVSSNSISVGDNPDATGIGAAVADEIRFLSTPGGVGFAVGQSVQGEWAAISGQGGAGLFGIGMGSSRSALRSSQLILNGKAADSIGGGGGGGISVGYLNTGSTGGAGSIGGAIVWEYG